jgi:aminoglycoside 6'-N-acetyltransferase
MDGAGHGAPHLRGELVALRPLGAEDEATLRGFLAEPAVARWWSSPADGSLLDDDGDGQLAIVAAGELAGLIAFDEELDPEYRHASIDLFLGTAFHGRGLGPDAVATLVRHLVEDRGHHRITIDPAAANGRAIAAYRRVGFRPVGVLRAYERDAASGTWHDGLLMDLLAGDIGLTPGPVPHGGDAD